MIENDKENFKMVKDGDNLDISLTSLDMGFEINSPILESAIGARSDNNTMLLDYFQFLQDIFVVFQKKLKEYEAVSEYLECDDIELYPSKKWSNLSEPEIQSFLPDLIESFRNTFTIILDKMRIMDNAVVRLRNENEKVIDQFKLDEINQKKFKTMNRMDSTDHQFQSVSLVREQVIKNELIDDLKSELKSSEKQLIKKTDKIKSLKEELEQTKTELNELENKNEILLKESKKLLKKIKELEEENDNKKIDDFSKIQKHMKIMLKEIQETKLEVTNQNSRNQFKMSSNFEMKIDDLLESIKEKDNSDKQKLFEIIEEIKYMKNEIKTFKEYNDHGHSGMLGEVKITQKEMDLKNEKENKALQVLRKRIEYLQEQITLKDEQLHNKAENIKYNENNLINHFEETSNQECSNGQYEKMDQDNEEFVVKDIVSTDFQNLSSSLNQLSIGTGMIQKLEATIADYKLQLDTSFNRERSANDKAVELQKIITENILKFEQKDQALETLRKKLQPFMIESSNFKDKEAHYEDEIQKLKNDIKVLHEDIEKKNRAINNMKEKIKTSNEMEYSAEEIEKLKRRIDQYDQEKKMVEELVTSLRKKIKEKTDNCEELKKDKLRLESEIENMKKLNFTKKTNE